MVRIQQEGDDELVMTCIGDGHRFVERRRYHIENQEVALYRIYEVWAFPLGGVSLVSYRMALGRGEDGRLRMRIARDLTLWGPDQKTIWLESCE